MRFRSSACTTSRIASPPRPPRWRSTSTANASPTRFGRFTAPPHRLQPVGTIAGVQYVNDSKATNVDAMIKAIQSFSAPVHLIAGGRDKDCPFAAAVPHLPGRVARAYLIGEAAETLAAAWAGAVEFSRCGTIEAALDEASARANPDEIVLLAPGCASFDQFRSYAHRGEVFTHWVQARAADAAQQEAPAS
jgi:UDP-N-acetylmuramoylalanine--D-glutamate ligase